jgi:Peptidase family M1 domain
MRRLLGALVVLLLALIEAGGTFAQQPPPVDGVVRLLLRLEQVMQAGNPEAYMDLLSAVAERRFARDAARQLVSPGITRAVIRERDRAPLEGTLPGDGYRLMIEILAERGSRARIETWRLDIRRVPTETSEDEWRVAGQQSLTSIDGLHRLALNPSRAYRARNLVVRSDDLEIRVPDGHVFTADTAEGPTAAVILAGDRGAMSFRPAPEAEREQVHIYAGSDAIEARVNDAFLRFSPSEFSSRFADGSLEEMSPDPVLFRRADALFRAHVVKSFSLDLADLSRDTWSLSPAPGDLLAEIGTRRFQTLTYSKSAGDPEDITVFDRRRRRNISVYASAARLAAGVSRFEEDARAAFDVVHYELDVSFDPVRNWLDGRALLRLQVRADAVNNLTLRLAENLTVRSIYSNEFGRLLSLRVRGQNNVLVNLAGYATRGTQLTLDITYSGRLEPAEPDRESAAPQFSQDRPEIVEAPSFPGETSLLYSTRTYWYPQGASGDYATAVMHLTVPEPYQVAASGELAPGSPVVVPGQGRQPPAHRYNFEARQPVRYLACLITRLVRADARTVSLVEPLASLASAGSRALPSEPLPAGSFNSQLDLVVEANPRQLARGRQAMPVAADIMSYYTSLVGDSPYSDLTLALIEKGLPGGHSPAYLAVLYQSPPTTATSWSNDPAAFVSFQEYFIAHELAHQWWGQAVGWRTYHDQWISEGFSQYFAALYARKRRGDGLFHDMLRRMAKWSREQGKAGSIALGYRLGHIQGDTRIFRAIVYNKSAVVLHMLRRLIGDDAFFRGIRRVYFGARFDKVGTDGVRVAFEKESGRDLRRFFDAWIGSSGTPAVAYSWARPADAAPPEVTLRVEQRGRDSEFPVTVTLHYAGGVVEDTQVVVQDRTAEFRLPVKGDLKNVTLNRDGLTPLEIVGR